MVLPDLDISGRVGVVHAEKSRFGQMHSILAGGGWRKMNVVFGPVAP